MASDFPSLISADDAHAQHKQGEILFIDASWHMPSSGRNGVGEYIIEHLPGAVFIDIDALANQRSPLPHMLPSAKAFADALGGLGITPTTKLVVYDSVGIFSAPRLWWMLRAYGHQDVAVLDGGLPAWKAAGYALEKGRPKRPAIDYTTPGRPGHRATCRHVQTLLAKRPNQVVDARSPSRFAGQEMEPRADLRSGHMPGSTNLHYQLLIMQDGRMKSVDALQQLVEDAGINLEEPIITSCGSGVTACIVALALDLLGHKQWQVYDGSWAEWGEVSRDTPVVHHLSSICGLTLPPLATGDVTFTVLRMDDPPAHPMPTTPHPQLSLIRAERPDVGFYRYLYYTIGRLWHWTDRLLLDDASLSEIIEDDRCAIYVLYIAGSPVGMAELDFTVMPHAKLSYLGVMPSHIGQGLGHYLLRAALGIAWQRLPDHLWVSTNTNDHPRALALYQKVGFRPVEQFSGHEVMFLENAASEQQIEGHLQSTPHSS